LVGTTADFRDWPTAFLGDQSLALWKSHNGGSNRRRRASSLEEQIARLPTCRELAKYAFVILFVGAVLGIVGIEAFWRYIPACGSI